MTALKILHLSASASAETGGPIEVIKRNHEVWARKGLALSTLATLDSPGIVHLEGLDLPQVALGPRADQPDHRPRPLRHYGYAPDYDQWILAHARDFDAVIVHGLWNYSTFAAARTLKKTGVPYFVFVHGMLDPWFKRTYPLKHLAKQLFWLVNEGPLMSGARRVFFTCEEEQIQAKDAFHAYNDYKSSIVRLGTRRPPERSAALDAAFQAAVPEVTSKPFLLFLSRLHPKKGCDLLIKAFAALHALRPELDLVIAGPDQVGWLKSLRQMAADTGLGDRIHFPGPLFGDSKWGAYYAAEAFVLPSHQENFGMVVAEALGCGLLVLISDKVNIWREIKKARAGLVHNDSLAETTKMLQAYGQMTLASRTEMRQSAVRLFGESFDIETSAPEALETIRSLL